MRACVGVCVCKQSNMKNQRKASCLSEPPFHLQKKNYVAEGKILIIAFYFILFLIVTHTRDTVYISGRMPFEDAVNSYFACEAVGYVPGKCDRESFEKILYPLIRANIAFYITTIFLPATILLYLVNCRSIMERFKIQKALTLKAVSAKSCANSTTNTESSNM